jgi:hypothetical protein
MPTPDVSNSVHELFDLVDRDILVCHTYKDGIIEMTVRKIGNRQLEFRVLSFRGSFRCERAELNRYFEELPTDTIDTQNQVSIYRDRFRVGLRGLSKNGFGQLRLDFSQCKKGNTAPIFCWMVSELLDRD